MQSHMIKLDIIKIHGSHHLCRTWSETQTVGFLMGRLMYHLTDVEEGNKRKRKPQDDVKEGRKKRKSVSSIVFVLLGLE